MRAPVSETAAVAAMVVGVVVVVLVGGAAMAARGGIVTDRPGKWFSWREFERSSTAARLGLHNAITAEGRRRIRLLVRHVLDPLRESLGRPVRVTSGWRTPDLNRAMGGAAGSQHMRGEAADIVVDGMTSEQLAAAVLRVARPDQLIWYAPERGGHVHVSWSADGDQRGEVLYAPAGGGYVARRPSA